MLNGAVSLTVLQRPASLFRQSEARTSRPHGGTRLWKCPSEKMGAGGGRRHSPRHQSLLVLLPAVRSQKMRLLSPLLDATSVPSCFPQSLRVLDPVRVLRANKASTMHLKAVRAKAAESLRCISRRITMRDATRRLSARGFSSGHRFASSVWLRAEGGGAQAPTAQGLQTDRYTGIVKL